MLRSTVTTFVRTLSLLLLSSSCLLRVVDSLVFGGETRTEAGPRPIIASKLLLLLLAVSFGVDARAQWTDELMSGEWMGVVLVIGFGAVNFCARQSHPCWPRLCLAERGGACMALGSAPLWGRAQRRVTPDDTTVDDGQERPRSKVSLSGTRLGGTVRLPVVTMRHDARDAHSLMRRRT
uniref:Secreted protein n=1 Tax=Plectus sambesii TaxID=2011161 RepID=A0A914VE80_9BILA